MMILVEEEIQMLQMLEGRGTYEDPPPTKNLMQLMVAGWRIFFFFFSSVTTDEMSCSCKKPSHQCCWEPPSENSWAHIK